MIEVNGIPIFCIEDYAGNVVDVKVKVVKRYADFLKKDVKEEGFTIRRNMPLSLKVECLNPTCTSCFDLSGLIKEAVEEKKELSGRMGCVGKEDASRMKNKGEGCGATLDYEITPHFS